MYTRFEWVTLKDTAWENLGIDEMILKCACCVQLVHFYYSCAFGKPMVQRVLRAWFLAILP